MHVSSRAPLLLMFLIVAMAPWAASQNALTASAVIPKYNLTNEIRARGIVVDTDDRLLLISSGLGLHLVLKSDDGTLEVHCTTTRFVNHYKLIF